MEKNICYPFKLDNTTDIKVPIFGIEEKMINESKVNNSAGLLTHNINLESDNNTLSFNFNNSNINGTMGENSKDSVMISLGDNLEKITKM